VLRRAAAVALFVFLGCVVASAHLGVVGIWISSWDKSKTKWGAARDLKNVIIVNMSERIERDFTSASSDKICCFVHGCVLIPRDSLAARQGGASRIFEFAPAFGKVKISGESSSLGLGQIAGSKPDIVGGCLTTILNDDLVHRIRLYVVWKSLTQIEGIAESTFESVTGDCDVSAKLTFFHVVGGMSQHFLLSAKARTLSLSAVLRMTDEEAETVFRSVRWTDGKAICPHCECPTVYECRRPSGALRFRCKACRKDFSITSGTLFAFHKMPLRNYLAAIAIFCNEVKGKSALALSRDLDVQYKTAFVLAHKLREAMASNSRACGSAAGTSTVEVDGGYFGGYVKPANHKEHRRDRRLARTRTASARWLS
jgi:transposase-like protein